MKSDKMKTDGKMQRMLSVAKKVVTLLAVTAVCFNAAADDDEILLPDISTTILKPDNGVPVDADAVPDFRLLLPEAGIELPDIADTGLAPDTFIPPKTDYNAELSDSAESVASDVFIEGSVGGGYPGIFSGDFSVYRNEGAEPFSLKFSHLTENGYGGHTASDGYSTSSTRLSGQKRFAFTDSLSLDIEGIYSTKADGLQGKSPLFYMLSNQNISGKADFAWIIGERAKLLSDVGVVFNNQFAGYNGTLPAGVSDSSIYFVVQPRVMFEYAFPFANGTALTLQARAGYDGGTKQNRVYGGIGASYLIGEYGTADASVDVVWTQNMTSSVVVPFQVGFKTGKQAPFICSVSGGLKSSASDFAALQEKIPYMFTDMKPFEESLWFAAADMSFPIEFSAAEGEPPAFAVKKIEPSLTVDFGKTAFGNKSLALFSVDGTTGLMTAQLADRLILDTSCGLGMSFLAGGVCEISFFAGWKGCWFDKDILEENHALSVKLGVADVNGNWGAETEVGISFLGEVPNLGFTTFYKLTNSMSLELELADFIKLVTGSDRPHCGNYIQKGGYAALYVKMLF